MAKANSFDHVIVNLNKVIHGKRYDAALALSKRYANLAKQTAQKKQGLAQGKGVYWTNRTQMAVKSMFGYTIATNDELGWGLAHGMEYGKWLELGKNRSVLPLIEPTVKELVPKFFEELKEIYAGK